MNDIVWTSSCPGRYVEVQGGNKSLWFSGTDYLGLAHCEVFQHFLQEGIYRLGTHYGSSRNNTVRLCIYEEAELLLADYLALPKAMTVSSGMIAGQLVIQHLSELIKKPYQIHYAPQVHPAITDKSYQPQHIDWATWATELIELLNQDTSSDLHVVITDAVGSPWVQHYDFALFKQVQRSERLLLIVDDSHGIGIVGEGGKGTASILKKELPYSEVLVISSLNKALGIAAGVIAGEECRVSQLRNIGLFSGASPMAPFYAYALIEMLRGGYYMQYYKKLQDNLQFLQQRGFYCNPTWTSIEAYPAFCSYRQDIHQDLMKQGIVTSCFAYPTLEDAPVMRLVVNAAHKEEDLRLLLEALQHY